MTSWMKDRDRLLEQTMAFVQGVTGKRPIEIASANHLDCNASSPASATSRTISDPSSAETDAIISMIAEVRSVPAAEVQMLPPTMSMPADPAPLIRPATPAPIYRPAKKPAVEFFIPERDLIAQRVARFRAGQQKTLHDREIQYAAEQARIRATLGSDPLA